MSLTSCKNTSIPEIANQNTEIEEEILQPEGSEVENDDRYAHLSKETTFSDGYLVSHFTDMDITYFTFDFVSYRPIQKSNSEELEYEMVNVIKTLRTFMVMGPYSTCDGKNKISIKDLISTYKTNPKTIFSIETVEGAVNKLYINNCTE